MRIYQLDTINQDDIISSYIIPAEDSAGVDTVGLTLSQLTKYLFNGAALSEGSPFEGINVAVGRQSFTDGDDCLAIGAKNTAANEGGVTEASAVGYQNQASGNWGASAIGYKNYAISSRTTSFGHKNHANEAGSSAIGNSNIASGYGSTSAGYYNTASGDYSSAIGKANTSSGYSSTACGYQNSATSNNSNAIGSQNAANSYQASALGAENTATTVRSSAVGFQNIASNIIWSDTYNISNVNTDAGTFTISGDHSSYFEDYILVQDNRYNNGIYSIDSVMYDGENGTIITVNEDIIDSSSSGTIRADISFRNDEQHSIVSVDLEGNIFTINDNFTNNFDVDRILISSSSGNDGVYTVNSVNYDGNTHIQVVETIPNYMASGNIRPRAQADGIGWGASAVGYKNQANDSQTSAFGHKNLVNAREASAFGSENEVWNTRGTACGYNNTVSNYYGDGGSGWGASAIGYRNYAMASQSSAFGHNNIVGGRNAAAFGSENSAMGERSMAFGYSNSASGYGNTACGYQNNADADYTTACGYNNNVTGPSSLACGYDNSANGLASTACGYDNTANGDYSTAIGANCYAGADYSTAIGRSATTRWPRTVNIGGGIIVKCDNFESGAADDIILNYSGVQNIIMTKDCDLTTTFEVTANIPTNCSFYVDEVGIIVDGTPVNVTVQPTIRFGWTGTLAGLKAAAITTNLTQVGSRERYTSVLDADGKQTLTAGVTVVATADYLHGRFYFKGVLVENTPVGS